MHPYFHERMVKDNQQRLEAGVRRAYLQGRRPLATAPSEPVLLRLRTVQDDAALERLATLEGRTAPVGDHVVAEVGGVVVAALPLGPGDPIADPFRLTEHLLPLLELRAKQLEEERPRRSEHGLRGVLRGLSRA
jgi:hypothetical protein